jgi:hypothetical protein
MRTENVAEMRQIKCYIYIYALLFGTFKELSTKMNATENFKIGQFFIEHWKLTDMYSCEAPVIFLDIIHWRVPLCRNFRLHI